MSKTRPRFSLRPRGVFVLACAQLVLSAVTLYVLLGFGLMEGFWESVMLGFGMMAVGALSCGILSHLNHRFKWLWIVVFCILPFVYLVPSIVLFVRTGDPLPLTFWVTYPVSLVLACYIGALLGEQFGWWNTMRRPVRKRYIRRMLRWLS